MTTRPIGPDDDLASQTQIARLGREESEPPSPLSLQQVSRRRGSFGKSGLVASGCNVENASYGMTICAERNAAFQLVAQGESSIVAIAIYTPTPTPTAPCGACRQVLNEFGPDMIVVSVCDGPERIETTLADLLPQAFGPRNL